ncbi:hypothetical protein CGZ94_15040 [Enemella evansiae]|uniref:DUF7847 domain-containing protein n=1 Tax=Enemella evansiae TaxID=2016499 RepID=A0A255GFH5_9ACTN|nr:hypothetical protein [Enemella evansiae]OYO11724.1 hypothetical protein CGZ94_15040 [Enemella evansiae]
MSSSPPPGTGPVPHPWGEAPGADRPTPPGPSPSGPSPSGPSAFPPGPPGGPNQLPPRPPVGRPPVQNWLRPGTVPLRPLGFTGVLEGAFRTYRWNPKAMVLVPLLLLGVIAVITTPLAWLASADLNFLDTDNPDLGALSRAVGLLMVPMLLPLLADLAITPLAAGATMAGVEGHRPGLGELWRRVRGRILPYLLVAVVLSLAQLLILALGTGLLIAALVLSGDGDPDLGLLIGGIALLLASVVAVTWLSIRLLLSPILVIVERVGIISAIRRSFALTRRAFWITFATILVASLIASTAAQVLSTAVSFILPLVATATGGQEQVPRLAIVTIALTQAITVALTQPYLASIRTMIYVDRRMRAEAYDAELIAAHRPAPEGTPWHPR